MKPGKKSVQKLIGGRLFEVYRQQSSTSGKGAPAPAACAERDHFVVDPNDTSPAPAIGECGGTSKPLRPGGSLRRALAVSLS